MDATSNAMPAAFLSILDISGRLGGRLLVAAPEDEDEDRLEVWVEVAISHHFTSMSINCD